MLTIILPVFAGIALAAASGFRVFVPLLVAAIASHFGVITPSHGFDWLGDWPAMTLLGVATVVEIVAFYVPWLDHALDTVATPSAIAAGITVMGAVVPPEHISPVIKWAMTIVAGGGAAGSIQVGTVGVRALSGATTAGLGNPVVATIEHVAAGVLAILAIVVPIFAFAIAVLLIFCVIRMVIKFHSRRRNRVASGISGCRTAA